jgi:hypothetical protein
MARKLLAAIAVGGFAGTLPTACLELSKPSDGEETLAARCTAAGASAVECAFFEEVLTLTHKETGENFAAEKFCDTIHSIVDCAHLISDVVTSGTVLDLVEAECLKRSDAHDTGYCAEVKAHAANLHHQDDARTLWQCYKAKTSARAEEAHRTHAEAVTEIAEAKAALAETPTAAEEQAAAAESGSGVGFVVVLLGIAGIGGAYYHRSRPRIVSLDDALVSHEGYSSVLDQYSHTY